MSHSTYRPWGQLSWLLSKDTTAKWDLLGSFSTEERCLAVRNTLVTNNRLRNCYLARIKDTDSPYETAINVELNKRLVDLKSTGASENEIHPHQLFESKDELISSINNFLTLSDGNVMVDISSLPKRFFFPAIKLMCESPAVTNLVACYTIPGTYSPYEMAEDFESWRPLPLFEGTPDDHVDTYFVGAGHMAMGLPEHLKSISNEVNICIFIPFPGHPHSFNRIWRFVRDIEKNIEAEKVVRKVVYARDIPEVFNYLTSETNGGSQKALFAPYGPKPISLAMCIFACQSSVNAPVYYTQPRIYLPDYSVGISYIDGLPQIYSYYLRLNGRNLYTLPNGSK